MFLMQMFAQRRGCDFSERSSICSVNLNTSNCVFLYTPHLFTFYFFPVFFHELLYAFKYGISILFKNEMERSIQLSYFKILSFLACKCGIENTRRIVGGEPVKPVRSHCSELLTSL